MPRTGPRRPLLAVKAAQEDIDAIDLIAEKAGVTRSDVVRLGLSAVLHNMSFESIQEFFRVSRETGEPPANTPAWQTAVTVGIAAVNEDARRTIEEMNQQAKGRSK